MPDAIVATVDSLIARAFEAGATDVHFEPTDACIRVRYRVDAILRDIEDLPRETAANMVARLKVLGGLLTYRTDIPQEGSWSYQQGPHHSDIRVSTFPTIRGERVVLRILAAAGRLLDLDELGHGPAVIASLRSCLETPAGLILVCGPAGSGKTTTLYALLRALVQARPGTSVFAVEDPVEIRMDSITQVQLEPQRGLDYATALRSLLRQDPQVLMIGEIRDRPTAEIVFEAALTGHLLLSTMHSGSVAEALVRLREIGIPAYQLTSSIRGVLAQRLVRRCCPDCGGKSGTTTCRHCLGSGYSGRVAVGQWLPMRAELRAALLGGGDADTLTAGQVDLHDDAARLVATGITTAAEVQRVLGSKPES